ncbi:MAG: FliA/WhiG family RNA polymerase sigma factor [Candidatus Neomarinimicrobiota bacterium]|nr:MAG: FliA/WhiG family RNA polymerase sigma factor [Candidatus Neomarinimicrobiota bacterium]
MNTALPIPAKDDVIRRYKETGDPQYKDLAIRSYLPLVKYIVGRIPPVANGNLSREDMYQFGVIGLIDALDRFNPEQGVEFKTFAYKRIHGEVIDAVRREGRLTRDQVHQLHKIDQAKKVLRHQLGREPSPAEVARKANLPLEKYEYLLQVRNQTILSLDEPVQGSEDGNPITRSETIPDTETPSLEESHDREEMKRELKEIIRNLPERKRLILALYYYEELTLADIGTVLNISESRVSQILSNTIVEIRQQLRW